MLTRNLPAIIVVDLHASEHMDRRLSDVRIFGATVEIVSSESSIPSMGCHRCQAPTDDQRMVGEAEGRLMEIRFSAVGDEGGLFGVSTVAIVLGGTDVLEGCWERVSLRKKEGTRDLQEDKSQEATTSTEFDGGRRRR